MSVNFSYPFFKGIYRHIILFFFILLSITPLAAHPFSTKANSFPCTSPTSTETDYPDNDIIFTQHLQTFSEEIALRYGFDQENLSCVFSQIRHNKKAIDLVKPPATGTIKNWQSYRVRFINASRITAGVKFWNEYKETLQKAENLYGIPPEIIVGIIGVETTYGKNKGNFRTLDVLATLAFDYPEHPKRDARIALFKKELEEVLLFCKEQQIDPLSLRGSYAGAIGWPQFLPSSIRKYAIDFNDDGLIDLRNSPEDAIGSVANFLNQHGWKKGEPLVFPVELSSPCPYPPETLLSKKLAAELTAEDLKKICISSKKLPNQFLFGLIDLPNGTDPTEYWLGTNNFFVITHYNRSFFYAMSIIELGHFIKTFYLRTEENSITE